MAKSHPKKKHPFDGRIEGKHAGVWGSENPGSVSTRLRPGGACPIRTSSVSSMRLSNGFLGFPGVGFGHGGPSPLTSLIKTNASPLGASKGPKPGMTTHRPGALKPRWRWNRFMMWSNKWQRWRNWQPLHPPPPLNGGWNPGTYSRLNSSRRGCRLVRAGSLNRQGKGRRSATKTLCPAFASANTFASTGPPSVHGWPRATVKG